MRKIIGLLRLTRPANLVTAVADILAGAAIAGLLIQESLQDLTLLILSTIGLYGGGVVFNDVFDADLDRVERPERPIPSGLVSVAEAMVLGCILLLSGVIFASIASVSSGLIAAGIAVAALVYDRWGKHHAIAGPVNMGLCRGLNLILGVSIIPAALEIFWPVAMVPLLYIAAITMISRGEVHGGSRIVLYLAMGLYVVVMSVILYVSFTQGRLPETLVILVFWGAMIFVPLARAIRDPQGRMIGKAVKAGVIALILMDAAWAASFGMAGLALAIILLLPLSLLLARLFAVT